MSDMIERVARAICPKYDREESELYIYGRMIVRERARQQARAAIEAMREPTDAMVSAADSDWGPQLRDNWREMIDAALGKVDA